MTQYDGLAIIRSLSQSLISHSDWQNFISDLLSRVGSALRADQVLVARAMETGEDLSLQVRQSWNRGEESEKKDPLSDFAYRQGPGEIVTALTNFEPFLAKKDEASSDVSQWMKGKEINTLFIFPIVRGSVLWGVFSLSRWTDSDDDASWDTRDIDFMWAVAGILSSRLGELGSGRFTWDSRQDKEENDRYFAQLTHDLKTPLNGILGYTQVLLRRGIDDEFFINCLGLIEKSGHKLLTMIENILSFTRGQQRSRGKILSSPIKIKGLSSSREERLLKTASQKKNESKTKKKWKYPVPPKPILLELKQCADSGDWKTLEHGISELSVEYHQFAKETETLVKGFHVEGVKAVLNQLIKQDES